MSLESLREKIIGINTNPTEAQKHAGNYKKGHIRIHGLDVSIENPKGSTRSGVSRDGKKWSSTLPDHYGYIKRTHGADGDHVDVYIGPDHDSTRVFVIDQKHHHTGKFDEHKCMINYRSVHDATKAYRAAFSDGHDRVLAITVMAIPRFKKWLDSGNTEKPIRYFSGHKS